MAEILQFPAREKPATHAAAEAAIERAVAAMILFAEALDYDLPRIFSDEDLMNAMARAALEAAWGGQDFDGAA